MTEAENEKGCIPAKRLDFCAGFASLNRGRAQVIDTKAGFISALNLGLIGSLWPGPALADKDVHAIVKFVGGTSTALARVSILLALWAVLPIGRVEKILGKGSDRAPKYHRSASTGTGHENLACRISTGIAGSAMAWTKWNSRTRPWSSIS